MKYRRGARAGLVLILSATLLAGLPSLSPAVAEESVVPDTTPSDWREAGALISAIKDAYTAPPDLSTVVNNGYTAGLLLGNGDLAVTSDVRDRAVNTMLLDPALIVIGGELAEAGDMVFEPLRKELAERLLWRQPPPIVPAGLGSSAGRLGAAIRALAVCS